MLGKSLKYFTVSQNLTKDVTWLCNWKKKAINGEKSRDRVLRKHETLVEIPLESGKTYLDWSVNWSPVCRFESDIYMESKNIPEGYVYLEWKYSVHLRTATKCKIFRNVCGTTPCGIYWLMFISITYRLDRPRTSGEPSSSRRGVSYRWSLLISFPQSLWYVCFRWEKELFKVRSGFTNWYM